MSKPDSITEDISRIRDDLAAIVTRDLIAGKVTSLRDAPRIVDIGRAIANLGKVSSRVLDLEDVVEDLAAERSEEYAAAWAEDGPQTVDELWEGLRRIEHARKAAEERARQAEEIVTDLAGINSVARDMGYHCVLCREAPAEWENMSLSEHSPSCPWRRAVEWLDDAVDSAVVDDLEFDIPQYAYRVQWSSEDGEYVATVAEFPSLSWLDADPVNALQGLIDVVADLGAAGEPIPEPENLGSERGNPDEELVREEE